MPAPFHTEIRLVESIEGLASDWQSLEARSDPSFFNSWYWIGSWLDCLEQPITVLAVYRDRQIVGLACLTTKTVRWRHLLERRAAYINTTGAETQDVISIEYNDILADRRWADEIRRAAFRALRDAFDIVVWRGAVASAQDRLQARRWLSRRLTEAPSAWIDLKAIRASGQPYLNHLSANTRQQIKRSMRLYEARGGLRLERARAFDEALQFFHEAGQLHQERWTARGKPGAFAFPFYLEMHKRVIAAALPTGAVELVRVTAGGRPVGYLYNFVYRGRVAFYLGGMRYEDDNRLKPGLVTHSLCIQAHLAGTAEVYDFMAGENRYKMSLGQAGPDIAALIAERAHPLVRLEASLRDLKNRFHS